MSELSIKNIEKVSSEFEYITWGDINGDTYGYTHDSRNLLDSDGCAFHEPDSDIVEAFENIVPKNYMDRHTGRVDTDENWAAVGETLENSDLIEVVLKIGPDWHPMGEWVERV